MKKIVYLLLFLICLSCGSQRLVKAEGKQVIELSVDQKTDSSLQNMINPYKTKMDAKMDSIIGFAVHSMEKKRPESDLGNFVADLTYKYGLEELQKESKGNSLNTFCLLNTGGLRSVISQGDISIGDCYTLMPFNNEIVILKLSGDKVEDILVYLEKSGGEPVSNLQLTIEKTSHNIKEVNCTIGGETLDNRKCYYVVTSDYLAKGGDNMNFFKDPLEYIQTGTLLRDAIIESIKLEHKPISSKIDGRIKLIKDE